MNEPSGVWLDLVLIWVAVLMLAIARMGIDGAVGGAALLLLGAGVRGLLRATG